MVARLVPRDSAMMPSLGLNGWRRWLRIYATAKDAMLLLQLLLLLLQMLILMH